MNLLGVSSKECLHRPLLLHLFGRKAYNLLLLGRRHNCTPKEVKSSVITPQTSATVVPFGGTINAA